MENKIIKISDTELKTNSFNYWLLLRNIINALILFLIFYEMDDKRVVFPIVFLLLFYGYILGFFEMFRNVNKNIVLTDDSVYINNEQFVKGNLEGVFVTDAGNRYYNSYRLELIFTTGTLLKKRKSIMACSKKSDALSNAQVIANFLNISINDTSGNGWILQNEEINTIKGAVQINSKIISFSKKISYVFLPLMQLLLLALLLLDNYNTARKNSVGIYKLNPEKSLLTCYSNDSDAYQWLVLSLNDDGTYSFNHNEPFIYSDTGVWNIHKGLGRAPYPEIHCGKGLFNKITLNRDGSISIKHPIPKDSMPGVDELCFDKMTIIGGSNVFH